MTSGPRRRTLVELAGVCADESLFAPLADGRVILAAQRQDLEVALGVSRGSLWRRTQTLVKAGLAEDDGRLIVDLEAVRSRLQPSVVSLPTERTRQYQELLEERFDTAVAADGTPSYHHADGRPATLSEIADATGASSRGTAHHHLRRLQSVPPPQAVGVPIEAGEQLVLAAQAAIESLGALAEAASTAGRPELATSVLHALESVSRSVAASLDADSPAIDVAVSARSKARHDAALREPERGANAAHAGTDPSTNEYENETSHRHDASAREAKRDATAASTDDGLAVGRVDRPAAKVSGCPAAGRDDFVELELPDWPVEDAAALVQPLVEAFAEKRGRNITVDTEWFLGDLRAWPRTWIVRAVEKMADQILAGRTIDNPGGLFAKAVQGGWYEYFPPTPPPEALDPETQARQMAQRFVADAEARLADMGPELSLGVTFEQLAQSIRNGVIAPVEAALPALLHSDLISTALADSAASGGVDPVSPLRQALCELGDAGAELSQWLPAPPTSSARPASETIREMKGRLQSAGSSG